MLASVAAGAVNGAVLLTGAGVGHIALLAAAKEALGNRDCLSHPGQGQGGPGTSNSWHRPQDFPHLETHQRSHNPDCRVVIDAVVTFPHQDTALLLPHVQDPRQVCICRPLPATHLAPLTGDDPVVDPR